MPYLLDGNNLIGAVRRTGKPSGDDRSALIAEIADRLRRTRARATLFFDGPIGERPTQLGGLAVRVPVAGSADDAILRELGASKTPREYVVVTADRELARRAKDAGAVVASPDEFFSRFGVSQRGGPAGSDSAPTANEVQEWMRYFEDPNNRK